MATRKKTRRRKGTTKLQAIGILLKRVRGCNRPQMLELTGWKAISMQQQCAALGLRLRMEKKPGELIQYYAS